MEIETNKEKSSHYEIVTESVESCEICFNSNSSSQTILCDCHHSFCQYCFNEYYKALKEDGCLFPFKCPVRGCGKLINKSLSQILDQQEFEKFKKQAKRHSRLCNPDIVWCPVINCDGFGMSIGNNPIKCNECEVVIETTINPSAKDLLETHSLIECPGCKALVSKTFGCMIRRCYCGTDFCNKCGSVNSETHSIWLCLSSDSNGRISEGCIILSLLCPLLVPLLPAFIVYLYREHWDRNYFPVLNEHPWLYLSLICIFSPMILVFAVFYLPLILAWGCVDVMFSGKSRRYSGWWVLLKILIYVPSILLVFIGGLLLVGLLISFLPFYGLALLSFKLGLLSKAPN